MVVISLYLTNLGLVRSDRLTSIINYIYCFSSTLPPTLSCYIDQNMLDLTFSFNSSSVEKYPEPRNCVFLLFVFNNLSIAAGCKKAEFHSVRLYRGTIERLQVADGTFYLSPSFIQKGLMNFICRHYYQQFLMQFNKTIAVCWYCMYCCLESHHNEEVAVWTICAG